MKKKLGVLIAVFMIIFTIIFFDQIINFIVNIKWFTEVGYLSVYFTKITAILKLMIPIFLISYIGIWIYYKSIKSSIMKFNKVLEVDSRKKKIGNRIFNILNLIISFTISFTFSSNYWYRILQFDNATKFSVKDPIFNIDVSFYMFRLPLVESLYRIFITLLVFLVVITLIIYFFMNTKDRISGFNMEDSISNIKSVRSGLTSFAGKQLAIVSALILLLLSLGYLIKSLNLVYSPRGVVFGASYTDIHITLLFYKILIVVCLISSIVIFLSVMASKVKPIIVSVGIIIVLIVVEAITSGVVQKFVVKSNEKSFEQQYIKYNIDYTRKAFNIDSIDEKKFEIKNDLNKEDINSNLDTIENIKVNSFKPALEFYNQVQVLRYYYGFNDIDVDRYNINGKYSQVFIAPREINTESLLENASTWQNKHLVYTHGYGVVMSKVNSVTPEGQPDFLVKDIPPENLTNIPITNPRIYFGEKTNDYAVVNTAVSEFDYPKGGENQTNKFDGKSGINMSLMNRIFFSINQRNINFLLSRDINSNSKILINRNIMDRVNKIAPFLTYDKDPYVIIDGGKLYWIIDAYTISDRYPFAQPEDNLNYIRNSVKVIIDATDGSTNFYIVDKNDPIVESYSKIFPKLFKPSEELPASIKQHFRYPEDLFNIQCKVLSKYHMTDPGVFYNSEDLWQVSKNQTQVETDKEANNNASYVIMKLPESKKEEMILLNYFNMRNKENMVALVGARMDADNYGKMVIYKFPPEKNVYSPYLFKQSFKQDTDISKELSLWNKEGSEVQFGDTVIVPINNSILYVEPMYLRASGKNSIPEMKRVIVSYGGKIVLAENINLAFQQLFNYNYKNDNNTEIKDTVLKAPNNEKLDKIKEAKGFYDKALESQKSGDWTKYGEYIKKLGDLLEEVNK